MINGKRVVAVIPARAGSKGIKNKNVKAFSGKPLIAWTIELAQSVPEIDRVIVSTDGESIADVAKEYGAEVYWRPKELAGDRALVIDAIKHLNKELDDQGETASYMLLLEATAPLRNVSDVSDSIHLLDNNNLDSVATFTEAKLNPHRAWKIFNNTPEAFIDGANAWLPRQQQPEAWELNGAVYAFTRAGVVKQNSSLLFGKTGSVVMPHERSIDIDTELDFMVVEKLMESKHEC